MDAFDRASELEQWQLQQALAKQAQHSPQAAGDWERASAKWCEADGCGDRIPDARRRAYPGVRFCVECQGMREQQQRRRR